MYFGESKQPHLRHPDAEKEQLAEQNALLKKLLHQQAEGVQTARTKRKPGIFLRMMDSNLRGVYVLCMIAVLVAFFAGGAWAVQHYRNDSGLIPGKYTHGLAFPLYYPTNLPSGYTIDRTSFKRQGNVLIFNIIAPLGPTIAVSEEAIPKNLNLTQNQNPSGIALPDQHNFSTAIGNAQVSLWGDKFVSSVVTQKTWLILNVTGYKIDDAQKITQAFTQLD